MVQRIFFLFRMVRLLFIKVLLLIGFLLKAGLPPFHTWIIRLLAGLKKISFLVILTLHKLLPLLLLAKTMKERGTVLILRILVAVLGISITNLRVLFLVLGLSSIIHSFWIVLSRLAGASLLSIYWITYSALSATFIFSTNSNWINTNEFGQTSITSLGWLLISGIPPFVLFWLKAHVSFVMLLELGLYFLALFLLNRVLALRAYYRTWHFNGLIAYRRLTRIIILTIFFLVSRRLF